MSFTSAPAVRRDLWITVIARAIAFAGDQLAVLTLTWRVAHDGSRPWAVSALLIAGLAPAVLFAPVAGRMADRYDSRRLLISVNLVQAALCLALAAVHDIPAVLALVFVLGIGQAIDGTTWQALLPRIVGDEQLPKAMGHSQAAMSLGLIAAPALTGVLISTVGTRVPLVIDAVSFLALVVAALLVQTRRQVSAEAREHSRGQAVIRRDPVLVALLTMLLVAILAAGAVNVVEVYLVSKTLHASAVWFGALGALWGGGMLIGSLVARRYEGEQALARAAVGALALIGISLSCYGVVPHVGWLVPAALVGGCANGVANVVIGALIMIRTPEELRGRVSAAANAVASGGMSGAYILGGIFGSLFGARTVYIWAGILGLLVTMVLARGLLRRIEPAAAVPVAASL